MSLVQRFLTGEYMVVRSRSGSYVRGVYVAGCKETICVQGSLQPATARELKLPEEGNRLKQFYKFYTDERILLNNTHTLADSDKIQINGETYRAMSREQWQNVDLEYFMTIVWREPNQSSDGSGC